MDALVVLKNDLILLDICEMIEEGELGDPDELGCIELTVDENDVLRQIVNG